MPTPEAGGMGAQKRLCWNVIEEAQEMARFDQVTSARPDVGKLRDFQSLWFFFFFFFFFFFCFYFFPRVKCTIMGDKYFSRKAAG